MFGSTKHKTYVNSQVVRVIPDEHLPEPELTAIFESVRFGYDLPTRLADAALNGPIGGFDRYYRKAEKGEYFYGLPEAKVRTTDEGNAEVITIIEALEGRPIEFDYIHFKPLNNVHMGMTHATENLGYNHETNELEVLSAQIGYPTYLGKVVPQYRRIDDEEPTPGATGFWIPEQGYSPTEPANPVLGNQRISEFAGGADGYIEGVILHWVWADSDGNSHTDQLFIDLSAYSADRSYFHARYTYEDDGTEVVKYWLYDIESGVHPSLEEVFAANYTAPGTYFPIVPFRRDKQNVARPDNQTSQEYLDCVDMLDTLNLDYQSISDDFHSDSDIGQVEDLVMMLAVPVNSESPIDQEYLFKYFDDLYERTPTEVGADYSRIVQMTAVHRRRAFIDIQDAGFRVTISYADILRRVKAGSFGPVGSYSSEYVDDYAITGGTFDGSNGVDRVLSRVHKFRHQITPHVYTEILVESPYSSYRIDGKNTVGGGQESDLLIVPIDRGIANQIPRLRRQQLYLRSLHFVMNSKVRVKQSWKEQDWFKGILVVAAVVITVVTLGKGYQTLAAAAALGTGALVVAIVKMILFSVLFRELFDVAAQELGAELAAILALVVSLYAIGAKSGTLPSTDMLNADRLLFIANGLVTASNRLVEEDTQTLLRQMQEFDEYASGALSELDELAKELSSNSGLYDPAYQLYPTPLSIMGESPSSYYARTAHSGNVGAMGPEIIRTFVDQSLKLPTIDQTIGA